MLLLVAGRRYGLELKYADAGGLTKSMHVALTDLRLRRRFAAYPGDKAGA